MFKEFLNYAKFVNIIQQFKYSQNPLSLVFYYGKRLFDLVLDKYNANDSLQIYL